MMDYDAVLAQVLALLQREQRLSYRVLKLRLQLDDEPPNLVERQADLAANLG